MFIKTLTPSELSLITTLIVSQLIEVGCVQPAMHVVEAE